MAGHGHRIWCEAPRDFRVLPILFSRFGESSLTCVLVSLAHPKAHSDISTLVLAYLFCQPDHRASRLSSLIVDTSSGHRFKCGRDSVVEVLRGRLRSSSNNAVRAHVESVCGHLESYCSKSASEGNRLLLRVPPRMCTSVHLHSEETLSGESIFLLAGSKLHPPVNF